MDGMGQIEAGERKKGCGQAEASGGKIIVSFASALDLARSRVSRSPSSLRLLADSLAYTTV